MPPTRFATFLAVAFCSTSIAADYPPPTGGWDYVFDGDAAAGDPAAALDGTWDHNNTSDQWDGTAPGTGNPGGVDVVAIAGEAGNNALRVVDAITVSGTGNNRRLSLTHDLATHEGVAGSLLDSGATLAFRLRLPTSATDLPSAPDGLGPVNGVKGIINLRGDAGRIGFSLGIAGTDAEYSSDGMRISNGGVTDFLALDPTVWNEFWATVVQNDSDTELHDLKVYMNGGTSPVYVETMTLSTTSDESYPYLSIQLPTTADTAAVEIDYIAFKDGVHLPNNSDGDALPDSWELLYFPDLSQGEDDDPDGDGLTNGEELNVGSNPTLPDTDGDELTDGDEFNLHGTDPTNADTDGDTIPDGAELDSVPPTDPTLADTDGDGLTDSDEISVHGTDPTLADTDDDGFSDGAEVGSGSDPNSNTSTPSFPTLDGLLVNEFMASNSTDLLDADGESSDWIELWNPTLSPVDLAGHYLTDDLAQPSKWALPAMVLLPNQFLVIFASGKDRNDPIAELHTDFQLDRAGGSSIALTRDNGEGGFVAVSAHGAYPKQVEDVSYGAYGATSPLSLGYFQTPTPGAPNDTPAVDGFVADTTFSSDRGFYSEAFTTTVATATPGATLIYTTDGTVPSAGNGTQVAAPDANTPPSADIVISTTTNLRAIATKAGFEPTNIDTHTYVFPAAVFAQSNATVPAHVNWGHAGPDYEMDPQIINHSDPEVRPVHEDLMRVPTVSLTMDWNIMFGGGGIYIAGEGVDRPTSIEFFNPTGDIVDPNTAKGFQVDGTVRIVGGSSTGRWKSDKLSMRLKFSPDLRYPVFGKSRTDRFDTLVLDHRLNNVWHYDGRNTGGGGRAQRDRAQYTHDQFPADLHNLMGGLSPEGRHCLLYINGVLWGITELHERPDDNFAAEYLGGDNSEYDAMKHRTSTVVAGSATAYNAMLGLSRQDMSNQANYEAVAEVLHIDNFIAYMVANYYVGNTDWAHQNWYATYGRDRPGGKWYYHSWDPEHCMESTNQNSTGRDDSGGPTEVFRNLIANPEFKLRFADLVHQHFHNDGALTPENAAAAYMRRAEPVNLISRIESARWGDNGRGNPYTRLDWLNNRDNLLGTAGGTSYSNYFPTRTGIVLGQFQSQNWYPDTDAPEFSQHGGPVAANFPLTITSPDGGTIYYTLDGTDPRIPAAAAEVVDYDLVAEGAIRRAIMPVDDSDDASWLTAGFDDSTWPTGTLGGGYDSAKYDPLFDPAFDFSDQVNGSNQETIFMRWEFEVDDPSVFDTMTIGVRYDDGYIAYLNGVEIASVNAGAAGPLAYNANASATHSDEDAAQQFQPTIVSQHLPLLNAGTNLLAVHGLNRGTGSSDMLIDAILMASEGVGGAAGGLSPSAVAYTGAVTLTNPESVVNARVFSGSEWSPVTTATFFVGTVPASASNLVISKLHYRPAAPSVEELAAGHNNRNDFEYTELLNIGDQPIDLTGVAFTVGIDFAFDSGAIKVLAPGARLLIVENAAAFEFRHGAGLPVAGEFANDTGLSNDGEQIVLLAADLSPIRDFTYNDKSPWPESADGGGFALVLIDPDANPDHALPGSWRSSTNPGGDPGLEDSSSFASWLAANFTAAELADPAVTGPLTDLDGDGLTLIEEYRFGGDPLVADAAGFSPAIALDAPGDALTLTVRLRNGEGDAGWSPQASLDGVVWSDATALFTLESEVDLGDGTQLLSYGFTAPVPEPGIANRLFRIQVSAP